MYPETDWKAREAELEALKAQRKELSERIHVLSIEIRQHKQTMKNPPDKTNTLAWKMFGKRMKDLTPDEYRKYYNVLQRKSRERRKQKQQKEEA